MQEKQFAALDANILIDLLEIELLEVVLDLPFLFTTTDFVKAEITDPEQSDALVLLVQANKLRIIQLDGEDLDKVSSLFQANPKLSLPDCSLLHLMKKESGLLLTGDRALRKAATKADVKVHGTLWILEKLVNEKLIPFQEACEKVKRLGESSARLPEKSLAHLISRWCGA